MLAILCMSKKLLIVGSVIAVLGAGGFFLYNRSNQASSTSCEDTESGWKCNFNSEDAKESYRQKCQDEGGRWSCYGQCLPNYDFYCDFSLADADEECHNSDECGLGKCLISRDFVDKNYPDREIQTDVSCKKECLGKCSKYPVRDCEWWFEVNNNKIEDHSDILCD